MLVTGCTSVRPLVRGIEDGCGYSFDPQVGLRLPTLSAVRHPAARQSNLAIGRRHVCRFSGVTSMNLRPTNGIDENQLKEEWR